MGYYTEISNSQYAAKDVALYKRIQGFNEHSFLGAMLSSKALNIFNFGAGIASGKINKESLQQALQQNSIFAQ